MAIDASHAAKQDDRTFTVELLSGEEPGAVLAAGHREFLDALDSAMEWLEREDPTRTKSASIGIFAIRDGMSVHTATSCPYNRSLLPLFSHRSSRSPSDGR